MTITAPLAADVVYVAESRLYNEVLLDSSIRSWMRQSPCRLGTSLLLLHVANRVNLEHCCKWAKAYALFKLVVVEAIDRMQKLITQLESERYVTSNEYAEIHSLNMPDSIAHCDHPLVNHPDLCSNTCKRISGCCNCFAFALVNGKHVPHHCIG